MNALRVACVCLLVSGLAGAQAQFGGVVVSSTQTPVVGARVLLKRGEGPALAAFTDAQGRFQIALAAEGRYWVTVEREGYFPIREQAVEIVKGQDATLVLEPVRELRESIEVSAAPVGVDMATTASQQGVTANEIANIPYPNTNDFRQALRVIPGVVRDNRGGLHIHGGGEDQVMYTLNGFNVTDPLTGRFESRLSVESVQSVEISSGAMAAEYGKGSAGTLAVRTNTGDDKFRYSATNFVPGIENRKGLIIGDWTPRATVSGPIKRGRAWFSESVDLQYINTVIRDLPKGADRAGSTRLTNLFHTQVNLTPGNILYSSFLFNRWSAGRTGLSALDPWETTMDRRSRQWFFNVKDQMYLPGRAVLEVGYAANRTFGREIPQGEGLLQYTPDGKRGFGFVDAIRSASRDQFLVNGFLPSFTAWGGHQLKSGIDLDRMSYEQTVRRTGFENYTDEGFVLRRTVYGGNGRLDRANYEASWFLQDSWRVRPGLLLELGIRADWGNILRRWDWSPRLGLAFSPEGWENTKVYGGVAQVFDAPNLRLFSRPQDQYALTTYFGPGGDVVRGPALTLFTVQNSRLKRPRYRNVTAGVEQTWLASVSLRAEYMRRRGSRGFSYLNTYEDGFGGPPPWISEYGAYSVDALFDLTNYRRDTFDSYSVSVRHNIKRLYEWMASYTYSRALSNTVVDVSVEDPVMVVNNVGRMAWDAPHRFLSWGYLPTPFKNWAVAYLVDTRSGFPFSTVTYDGRIAGAVSSRRYPTFFEVNLHLERRFDFRNHRWALRFGGNNLTGRINPDTVNNIVESPRFLTFYGGNGRAVQFRIRWLGKK